MSVSKSATVTGSLKIGPVQPTSYPFPTGEGVASLNSTQTVTASSGPKGLSINSPAAFVDLLTGAGVTNIKMLSVRVRAGTVTLRISSAAGVDQLLSVSDLLVLSNPVDSSAWTALAAQGVADLELMIAGT